MPAKKKQVAAPTTVGVDENIPANVHVPAADGKLGKNDAAEEVISTISNSQDDLEDNNVQGEVMDEEEQQAYLDSLFEEQSREKIRALPKKKLDLDKKKILKTKLKPHQVDGIRWLIHQERTVQENPFFKQIAKKEHPTFRCSLTGRHIYHPPKPIGGAILADDMGLGKTLQTYGLILSNPAPNNERTPYVTLIVSPVSVMANWTQQADQHIKEDALSVGIYQGPKRHTMIPAIQNHEYNVVVVSYDTLRSDFANHQKATKEGTTPPASLFSVEYHRIVLDEAHLVRSPSSKFFKAVTNVKATNKLGLTGTPFVNSPDDLWSLMAFVGVEPLTDRKIFEEHITEKIKLGRPCGLARLRVAMSHISLRRTKKTIDLGLEPKVTQFIKVPFQEGVHKDVHDAVFRTAQAGLAAVFHGEESDIRKQGLRSMFSLIIRIRQACLSAEMLSSEFRERMIELEDQMGSADELNPEQGFELLQQMKEISALASKKMVIKDPKLSKNDMESLVATLSGMSLSEDQIKEFKEKHAKKKKMKTLELSPSPKVTALLKTIETDMKPDEKGVIFSFFTSMLDLLEPSLEASNHSFTRLDGKMSAEERVKALEEFNNNDGPRFILCSLKTAGLGINLTRGNVAFMMDPWWNYAAEDQAADRIHRLGQTRAVRVFRFVMQDTIEERLLSIQSRKAAMGKGSMEMLSNKELQRAKVTAMKDLFQIDKSGAGDNFWSDFTDSDDEFIVGEYDDDGSSSA